MSHSPLFGRRVHIAGSVIDSNYLSSNKEVLGAREFVKDLVIDLMRKGACFVIPVDADKRRTNDDLPICFDWLVWETVSLNLAKRPTSAPNPLVIAIQHHKSEAQIPADKVAMWDNLRDSDFVSIDNASHWNMASKRMEMQAVHGDILITLGGSEGVLFLANLYHQAGKPVVPLNFELCPGDMGSRKLFSQALSSQTTSRFFRISGDVPAHAWINRLNFSARHNAQHRVTEVVRLLESLERPTAFAIRLLNPKHEDYQHVEDYFGVVVKHVIEEELGYSLRVVDGKQPNEYSRIDAEIFNKLHHSSVVVADITGARPNCFVELGYALGRSTATILMGKTGTESPFDVMTLPCHDWDPSHSVAEKRRLFREHWSANINRPSLVIPDPLVP